MTEKAGQPISEQETQNYTKILEKHDYLITSTAAWGKWHFDKTTQEDVAQRIRLELVQSDIREKPPDKIPSCIRRLAISRCIDEVRKLVRRNQTFVQVETELDAYPSSPNPSPTSLDPVREIMEDEERNSLRTAVMSLGEPCGPVITSFYLKHLSYREIATEQGIDIGTVGSRLSRCMQKLQALLRENPRLMEDLQQSMRT